MGAQTHPAHAHKRPTRAPRAPLSHACQCGGARGARATVRRFTGEAEGWSTPRVTRLGAVCTARDRRRPHAADERAPLRVKVVRAAGREAVRVVEQVEAGRHQPSHRAVDVRLRLARLERRVRPQVAVPVDAVLREEGGGGGGLGDAAGQQRLQRLPVALRLLREALRQLLPVGAGEPVELRGAPEESRVVADRQVLQVGPVAGGRTLGALDEQVERAHVQVGQLDAAFDQRLQLRCLP
eukprot:261598-Prymnesium_polylepis.1